MGDDAIGTDGGVIADVDLAEYFGTRPDVDIITNGGNTCPFATATDANGNLMRKVAVFTNYRKFTHNDSALMPDIQTWTHLGFVGNANTKADLLMAIDQPGQRE